MYTKLLLTEEIKMSNFLENDLGRNEQVVLVGKLHILTILPWHFIRYATTKLGFTNKRVVGKVGFIKKQSLDAPLNKINNVGVSQGLFGKIFNWGTVEIDTSSGKYYFPCIVKPNEFKNKLMAQVDQFEEDRLTAQAQQLANAIKN